LNALGIGPGDEVIVPAFTWIATANAVVYCGAKPVFVDVLPETYNIDPEQVRHALTDGTKAIIAVHLFGLAADMDALQSAAPHVPIIEDAACAVGASYKGRLIGSLGELGCFSFHPRKIITTGEGGIVTTQQDELAHTINTLRNHGASISEEQRHHGAQPYLLPDFDVVGFNYRMTDLQGALGLVQLSKLESLLADRRQRAEQYHEALSGLTWLQTPATPAAYQHTWQSYVCRVDGTRAPCTRNTIMERLQSRGISTRPGTHAVHRTGAYRTTDNPSTDTCPVASDCERSTLTLPLFGRMQDDDYQYVIEELFTLDS
jgi:dTDP-4-amino-4,6-dideoxygalactose transaminase